MHFLKYKYFVCDKPHTIQSFGVKLYINNIIMDGKFISPTNNKHFNKDSSFNVYVNNTDNIVKFQDNSFVESIIHNAVFKLLICFLIDGFCNGGIIFDVTISSVVIVIYLFLNNGIKM